MKSKTKSTAKKLLSLLLSLAMLLSITAGLDLSAYAYESADNFRYEVKNGEVEFKYYDGYREEEFAVPATVEGYPVTSIGAFAFDEAYGLKIVSIPETVKSIDRLSFRKCPDLQEINVDPANEAYASIDGVLYTKDMTTLFKFPSSNQAVDYTIPETVTTIAESALTDNRYLVSVTMPEGLTTIGTWAFDGCEELEEIYIPDSVTTIGNYAFSYSDKLQSITVGENNENYTSVDGVLFTKDMTTLLQYPIGNTREEYAIPDGVITLANASFSGCSSLTGVTIPDSVTTLGGSAFQDCSSLKSVVIPDSVTKTNYQTFNNCSSLESVTISKGLTEISGNDFAGCTSLTSITIPDNITYIEGSAFAGCTSLSDITIGSGVTSLNNAFEGCSAIENITVSPDNETYATVDGVLFTKDMTELVLYPSANPATEYVIPDSVEYVNTALTHCPNLESIVMGSGLNYFYDYTFEGCDNLKNITIGSGVNYIDDWDAFIAFKKLENINVHPDNADYTSVDGVLFTKDMTTLFAYPQANPRTEYAIPDGVVTVGNSAFEGAKNLNSVTIPSSVETLSYEAFIGCTGLTAVVIPEGVTTLENRVFYGCSNLTDVFLPLSLTSIGAYSFWNCNKLEDVYYPGTAQDENSDWAQLTMATESGNNPIIEAPRKHFETPQSEFYDHYALIDEVPPQCNYPGKELYICPHDYYKSVETDPPLGHSYVNGECERCGNLLESPHPYPENYDETWVIYKEGATSIDLTFSDETWTESHSDYIYIYDRDDKEVGNYNYTGWQLAGETVTVIGDTAKIRLVSDDSYASFESYGFALTSINVNYTPLCDHLRTEVRGAYDATCSQMGYTGDTYCLDCEQLIENGTYISTIPHTFDDGVVTTQPTCTSYGFKTYTCTVCGETVDDTENPLPMTDHTFDDGVVTTPATCNSDGEKTFTCSVCGETKNEPIPKLEHVWDNGVVKTAATCTAKGEMLYTCTLCGETKYEDIAMLEHNFTDVGTKATLEQDGKVVPTCTLCGETKDEKIIYSPKTFALSATSYTYDGKAKKPTVTVKDANGNVIDSSNYTVAYSGNCTDVGKYNVTVTFKGNYEGTKVLSFEIKGVDQWLKSGKRWWYRHADGSYTKNAWEKIDGKWYHFDKDGWMQTGWLKDGGKWYYLNSSGVMTTGWQKVSNKWYFMNSSGVMQTGWEKIGGKWYYFNSSGVMQTGWLKLGGKWYYMNSSGVMLTGRQKIGNKWYTFNSSGVWVK